VIVAAGAGDGKGLEGFADDVDLIINDDDFFIADVGGGMDAGAEVEKTRANDGFVGLIHGIEPGCFDEITGEVFGQKLVVGHIVIECSDEIIAITPWVGESMVELVAPGFGVADQVEPMAGPSFTKGFGGEQFVNESAIGIGGFVGQEGLDVGRCWRQAG